jgi:hypothetical protein
MIEILFALFCAVAGVQWMGKKGKSKALGFFLGLFLNIIGLGIIAYLVRTKNPKVEKPAKVKRERPVRAKPENKGYKPAKGNRAIFKVNRSYDLSCGHKILVGAPNHNLEGKMVTCDVCKEQRMVIRQYSSI